MDGIEPDINLLFNVIPTKISDLLNSIPDRSELLEIVLDLGRKPEARFVETNIFLETSDVIQSDIDHVVAHVGNFGRDNRAGIERTLHRISAIRNRDGKIIGITLRVGRSIHGTIKIIEDLILSGKSVLLLGKPGVGKTTMLRDVARLLADQGNKRVIVVDTSNEIAGDGDIPHSAIGKSRRMQVPTPNKQHSIMIEAVENHMPEVIIIDEIGTLLEANAARTIAERGVQLVATAHGNTIDNIVMNPILSDLVGGIESVTLGDLEAKRRRTQKTVLERKSSPTFDILVEIQNWNTVNVHHDVSTTLDKILRDKPTKSEVRTIDANGHMIKKSCDLKTIGPTRPLLTEETEQSMPTENQSIKLKKILSYGVNRGRINQVIKNLGAPVILVDDMSEAETVVTTKNYHRRGTQALKNAELLGKPVFVLRKNTSNQIEYFIKAVIKTSTKNPNNSTIQSLAIFEAEQAIKLIKDGESKIKLRPQNSHTRRLQHIIANESGLNSSSSGDDPTRHVVISMSG
jgi:stage III sporulation protein SpoIIIAA